MTGTMTVYGTEEMERVAGTWAARLSPHAMSATVATLSGDLGVGKTTFVRGVLRSLGVTEAVTSPTFVIEKVYEPLRGPWKRVVHIDAYRLHGAHELEVLGWREMCADCDTLILIEWPEMVPGAAPDNARILSFSVMPDDGRRIGGLES
jgi:tRNA threonylcarbamoyladenosine biosynthesis protein TsaE